MRKRHTIFYKNIAIADYSSAEDFMLRDADEIFIENLDRFDSPEEVTAFLENIFKNLFYFLRGNIPAGIRHRVLSEQCGSSNPLDIAARLDEFSGDISIDREEFRQYIPLAPSAKSGIEVSTTISPQEFEFPASQRAMGTRPSSFAGYFDKFTAVLEETESGLILRQSDYNMEVGNVIVKAQGEHYPLICANEAFCLGLAEQCGIETSRRWTVGVNSGWGVKKHFITERFGVHCNEKGIVSRDLIYDTGILLGDKIRDQYAISTEDYFDFMRTLISPEDMDKFSRAYLLGFIIGNCDMHVKNFSVKYTGRDFQLTPQYDIVSYKPYGLQEDLALLLNGKNTVSSEVFADFVIDQGLSASSIRDVCESVMDNFDNTAKVYLDLNDEKENTLYSRIKEYTERRSLEVLSALNKYRSHEEYQERLI